MEILMRVLPAVRMALFSLGCHLYNNLNIILDLPLQFLMTIKSMSTQMVSAFCSATYLSCEGSFSFLRFALPEASCGCKPCHLWFIYGVSRKNPL